MLADRLIVDPGIGFAKRAEHSYGVLARLSELAGRLDRPLLVGVRASRFCAAASAIGPHRSATGARPRP